MTILYKVEWKNSPKKAVSCYSGYIMTRRYQDTEQLLRWKTMLKPLYNQNEK